MCIRFIGCLAIYIRQEYRLKHNKSYTQRFLFVSVPCDFHFIHLIRFGFLFNVIDNNFNLNVTTKTDHFIEQRKKTELNE